MFRMKQKVKIVSSQKADGKYNYGKVVGIEYTQDAHYLGYKTEKEFLARYTVPRYKVAFVDCFTERAEDGWFNEAELESGAT